MDHILSVLLADMIRPDRLKLGWDRDESDK
jgi:hypothetical protein